MPNPFAAALRFIFALLSRHFLSGNIVSAYFSTRPAAGATLDSTEIGGSSADFRLICGQFV
jgi:hypothetical protein